MNDKSALILSTSSIAVVGAIAFTLIVVLSDTTLDESTRDNLTTMLMLCPPIMLGIMFWNLYTTKVWKIFTDPYSLMDSKNTDLR